MKLISMTTFIRELPLINDENNAKKQNNKILKYASFLTQPLKLEMFVNCDENGNFLKPVFGEESEYFYSNEYDKAKEKVLFEGFEQKDRGTYIGIYLKDKIILKIWKDDLKAELAYKYYTENESAKIEDLVKYRPILTPNAIKKSGL